MTGVDLTPRPYYRRCRSRNALRVWASLAGVCLLMALAPIALESSQPVDQSASLAEDRLVIAKARINQNRVRLRTMQSQSYQFERELQAGAHLTRRPDWSELLNRIAAQFEGGILMTGVRLGSASDADVRRGLGVAAQDAPDESQWIILSGVAAENSDVPDLILRLESIGLFDRVVMTQAQRKSFAGGQRSGFVLACRVQ